MPLVDVHLIKGVFNAEEKNELITKVTDAVVAVEGEALRGTTWVRIFEVNEGEWAIGGKPMTAAMINDVRGQSDRKKAAG
jgi:4-oxalocrotonate tautomerase